MCGGGGPNPDDFNKPTPQEHALAEVAANYWNRRQAEGIPLENAYIADVTGLTPDEKGLSGMAPETMRTTAITHGVERAGVAAGQANADLMQKIDPLAIDPNKGPARSGGAAKLATKISGDVTRDTIAQQGATTMGIVESALGGQATTNSALEGMASDAVKRNIADAESEYSNQASTVQSALSGVGMAIQAGRDLKKVK